MIVEPFQAGGFLLTDVGDLSERASDRVTLAIARGLREFPPEFYCDAVGRDPEGEFPMMRLQVSNPPGNQVYGGAWMGCNELAPGHTATDAKIFTRPVVGPRIQFEAIFWNSTALVLILKHILDNPILVRGGGTIQVMGFDYITDPSVTTAGLGTIHGAWDARMRLDPFLDLTETDLGGGKADVRVTKSSPGPP